MTDQVDPGLSVSVRNVGGIDSLQLEFSPGVTVLVGRNATNRTSLLRALVAGVGGSDGVLKSDADEGEVELVVGGDRATRWFERSNGSVRVTGDPYTDETDLVDACCSLLETNPARRAVERGDGDDLREALMRPVDTGSIETKIADCRQELRSVEDRIRTIERRKGSLPDLEERRQKRLAELDSLESEVESVREALDEYEADVEETEAAQAVLEDLRSTRDEFERIRARRDTQRSALDSLRAERESVEAELDDLTVPEAELAETNDELEHLRERERDLENTVDTLVSILEFNEQMLDAGPGDLFPDDGDRDPAADLVPDARSIECWTCGTVVERGDVAARLDDLRETVENRRNDRRDLRDRIDDLRATRAELREAVDRRESLGDDLTGIEAEIDNRESRLDDLEDEAEPLQDRIEQLEREAAESGDLGESDLLDRYQELSELEYERGQTEERLSTVEEEIAEIEELGEELHDLRTRRDELRRRVEELRTRVEELERSVVDTFNDRMATLVGLLEYENVERVWVERKAGDGSGVESTFDLHVVRADDEGSVYEGRVDHLSESEREVIGLVVALTGYLVHEAQETVPVMVLDSLESIDSGRIAALVEYFADHVPYLVVALLPEDARALPDRFRRVEMEDVEAREP